MSDFSLFPTKKLGKPGWEYRKATWPDGIDEEVHKLMDKISTEPVYYNRKRNYDGKDQYCKVYVDENGNVLVNPGDDYTFLVRKDSENNKEPVVDNTEVPHDMLCKICFVNKSTHAVMECGHVAMCVLCAKRVYDDTHQCPICKTEMEGPPTKLFFA